MGYLDQVFGVDPLAESSPDVFGLEFEVMLSRTNRLVQWKSQNCARNHTSGNRIHTRFGERDFSQEKCFRLFQFILSGWRVLHVPQVTHHIVPAGRSYVPTVFVGM